MAPGIVAEKSIVWRDAGVSDMSVSTSGRKPRSSISSASSSTTVRACDRSRWPCLARSMRRPGVPTTTSTPVLQGLDLGLVGAAAVDGEHPDAALAARALEVARDLHGELTRRGDGEGLRLAGTGERLEGLLAGRHDAVEDRHAEAEGLAGAGLGLADDVVAAEGDRAGSSPGWGRA